MSDKRISQLVERVTIANNDVLPIVALNAATTNKVTISTIQDWMQTHMDLGVTSISVNTSTSGSDITISGSPITSTGTITINIPTASATKRGALSSTDWSTFNGKQDVLTFYSPLQKNGVSVTIDQADTDTNGYLSFTDWNTFNNKEGALTKGNLTESISGVLTIIGGTAAVIGTGTTIEVKQASGSQDGFLDSADWTTFNNKVSTSRSISTTAPLQGGGDLSANRTLSITQSGSASNGYLSSTDWNTFNNKQNALSGTGVVKSTAGTISYINGLATQYIDGTGSLQTFPSIIGTANNLTREVYNETGATLVKGTVVYINGGHGNLPTIAKALATGDSTSAQTYGVVQTDIGNNSNGYIVVIGDLFDMPTNGYLTGTQLYLSSTTAGEFTSTKQYAPAHLVYVGIVTRSHPTQGVIAIKIQNGYEMDELHDVYARNPDNNDILQYKTATSLWTKVAGSTTNIAEGTNLYYTDARSRGAFSESVTGLDYNSTTGVLSTTAGYGIPTTASQSNWDAAYNDKINSAAVTGTTTKTLTLTQQDGGTITASWTDINTDAVSSVFGRTGAVVAVSGDYTTAQVTESGNLYFTNGRARSAISLTTTGTSGAATYNDVTGVLNIPSYVGGVTSVFGRTGAVVAVSGDYDTDKVTEGTTNLYFTNTRARAAISLTTTGTSGAATYVAGVLNIPNYSTDLSGYVTLATAQTISGAKIFSNAVNIRYDGGTTVDSVLRLRGTNTTARTTRLQFEDYSGAIADAIIDFKIPTAGTASSAVLSMGVNAASTLSLNYNGVGFFSGRLNINGAGDDADIATTIKAPSGAGKYILVGRDSSETWNFSVASSGDTRIGYNQSGAVFKLLTLQSNGNNLDTGTVLRLIGNSALDLLDISVADTTSRIYHQENAADASGGYGWIQIRTNAAENSSAPTRGGIKLTIDTTDVLTIDNIRRTTFSSTVKAAGISIGKDAVSNILYVAGENSNYDGTIRLGERTYIRGLDGGNTTTSIANDYNSDLAKFEVRMKGDASANAKLTILGSGASTFTGSVSAANFSTGGNIETTTTGAGYYVYGSKPAIRYSYFGYSSGYNGILVGGGTNQTLFFNVDVTGNPSGAFSGLGSECVFRNAGSFITPNSINNGYNTLFSWNSSGQVTINNLVASTFSLGNSIQLGDYSGSPVLTMAAANNGINKINFYDQNATEGLYLRTDGEAYGGTMTFGARWNVDYAKIVFKMYSVADGAAYNARVGIGTTNPAGELTVKRSWSSAYTPIYFGNTGYTAWNRQTYDTFVLQQDDVTSFRMVEKNGEDTTSDQVLSFSIGDGAGAIATSAQPLDFFVNGSPSGLAYQGLSGTKVVRMNTNGTTNFYYTLTCSADVIAYSDVRLKTNIETIDNANDLVNKMRGVFYNRKDTEDKSRKVGVIAQEMQKILPEVVSVSEDGTLGVAYGNIVAVLIEAVKNQQEQINDLKKQIA